MPARMDVHSAGFLRDFINEHVALFDRIEGAGLPGRGDSQVHRAGLRAQARIVAREMKNRVQVRTGRTKSRIRIFTRVEQGGRAVGQVRVPPPWNILEFGREAGPGYGSAPPYPFIYNSITSTANPQLVAYGEAVQKAIAKRRAKA